MVRIKRGTTALKHRKYVLAKTKGYRFGRRTKEKQAKEAIFHAGNHAFNHRKDKKGDFRRLWTVRINAAVRPLGLSYSRLIDALNKKGVAVNRKMLSELAQTSPHIFNKIVDFVK